MIQLQPLAQVPSLCTNSRLELELEVVHLVMGFANPTILPGFYYNNGSLPWVGVPSETQSSSAPVPGRGVSGYFISSWALNSTGHSPTCHPKYFQALSHLPLQPCSSGITLSYGANVDRSLLLPRERQIIARLQITLNNEIKAKAGPICRQTGAGASSQTSFAAPSFVSSDPLAVSLWLGAVHSLREVISILEGPPVSWTSSVHFAGTIPWAVSLKITLEICLV